MVTIYDDDLPTVGIVATTPNATESSPTDGYFTVTRNGPTDQPPLLVPYTIEGTAANGDEYQILSGDVLIEAGSNSATITVHPLDVGKVGGSTTVTLALQNNGDYKPDLNASSDTVTIADDDPPMVRLYEASPILSDTWGGAAIIGVSRNGPTDQPLVVHLTVNANPGDEVRSRTAATPKTRKANILDGQC